MSVKIYDTMTTATSNFPLAYAEKINIVKEDGSEADIQTLYNNGELGGSGSETGISTADSVTYDNPNFVQYDTVDAALDALFAAVGALIDDTSVNSNKVWSSQKINEECIKVHKKNTSVTTAVYQWFTARYDPQTKQISTTIPITIADDVSNVSLDFGDRKIILHTGSGEVEQTPTQVSAVGIEDSKSLGLLRFDMKVDSGDASINCIAIPAGTTITFS